jgi:hypothetical protein
LFSFLQKKTVMRYEFVRICVDSTVFWTLLKAVFLKIGCLRKRFMKYGVFTKAFLNSAFTYNQLQRSVGRIDFKTPTI